MEVKPVKEVEVLKEKIKEEPYKAKAWLIELRKTQQRRLPMCIPTNSE
jgi:hypothetical protein